MAWVTVIGPDMAQVEYRLTAECGCDQDAQVEYRTAGAAGDLTWVGKGLGEVGIAPGTRVDPDDARALMSGKDPRDQRVLLTPKVGVDPDAKLSPGPLVAMLRSAAAEADVPLVEILGDPKLVKLVEQAERGVARRKGGHRMPVKELEKIAAAAAHVTGTTLDDLYPADELATARELADARVRTGNRGFDLVLDLPKSFSAAVALAPEALAEALEQTFLKAARETVDAVEEWVGYTLRGHSGDGKTPDRVDSSGLLGWMTVHRSARPIGDTAGDPHLHVHVNLASMVRSVDGKWRVFGSGGRDLYRHARAADSLVKARLRTLTAEKFGMRWERDPKTEAWEVVGIDPGVRTAFSRRSIDAVERAGADASSAQQKLAAARAKEAKQTETTRRDVRAEWRARAGALVDVDAMIRAAVPHGPGDPTPTGPGTPPPILPTPAEIAAIVLDPETGLTAGRKAFTRADLLASVIDAIPVGLVTLAQADRLADDVLREDGPCAAVRLPDTATTRMSNAHRYTSADILAAEQSVIDHAIAGCTGERFAAVAPDVAAAALQVVETGQGWTFSTEQVDVLDRLLVGGNAIDAVVGVAGAGKTTLMSAARAAWETRDLVVAGASTAAVASENLFREAGIPAKNLTQWKHALDTGDGLLGVDVLVVDEAAMSDDRMLARLCVEAARTDTKIVLVGDPEQLRAIGVGGLFAEVHRLTSGLELTENRRQRDPLERAALRTWRTGDRRGALQTLADAGHLHATDSPEQAHAELVTAWTNAYTGHADPHDRIERVLMLAGRNTDVDRLNEHARALARERGDLTGQDVPRRLDDGNVLRLAVGDVVRVRRNDFRSGRDEGPDVLNGYRGVILEQDRRRGARIEWRTAGPDGPVLAQAWIGPEHLARGDLSHGYAMTIASAQGLTCDAAFVYGTDADAYTIYPGITRARTRTDTWLALDALEDDSTRARLGTPRTEDERLARAVDAYADRVQNDRPDTVIRHELHEPAIPPPVPERLDGIRATLDRITAANARAEMWQTMRDRPHGTVLTASLLTDAEAADTSATRAEQTAQDRVLAAAAHLIDAREGNGRHVRELHAERARFLPAAEQQARADHHRARADAFDRQAAAARSHERDLTRQQGLGRITLWRAGTSRAQLRTGIDAASEHAEAAERATRDERREQYAAEQEVQRLRPTYANPLTRLREMDADWTRLHGDALNADIDHAEHTVTRERGRAAVALHTAAADRERARALREEAAARAELPAEQLAFEDTERALLEQSRSEEAARERAQRAERLQRQQRQQALHRRPPTRGGPGRGFSL